MCRSTVGFALLPVGSLTFILLELKLNIHLELEMRLRNRGAIRLHGLVLRHT
jgi:hypothetical protein